jgi:hypothetical protein
MKKFTTITGLSESRRMPRLDKIRLGAKILKAETKKEYPIELPFFLLPDEVAKVHGGKIISVELAKEMKTTRADALKFIKENLHRLALELPVMIPVEEIEQAFPQSYKFYGGSIGLKCHGNGVEASERVGITNEWKDIKCPCSELKTDQNPKGACSRQANLRVILPEVDMGGVYQIDIGSINSIIDINSGIDYVKSLFGRVAMIPLIMRRVATETHHDGKKQIHWTVQLKPVGNIHAIINMRENNKMLTHTQVLQLEEPELKDPELDPPDAMYEQPKHITIKIDELNKLKAAKKLKKGEIEAIRKAVEENDEATIETIHKNVLARIPVGNTADDVAKKLAKKEEPPEPVKPEPDKNDRI